MVSRTLLCLLYIILYIHEFFQHIMQSSINTRILITELLSIALVRENYEHHDHV